MERLFVDTSAWYAHANRADPDHDAVRRLLRDFRGRLVITNFVFDETMTLCRIRLGHRAATRVGDVLRDPAVVDLVRITAEDEDAAWRLFVGRPDKRYSYTDCTSFAVMRRLGLHRAAALDEHFRQEGFEVVP